MCRGLLGIWLLLLSVAPCAAQPATPAVPADANQPRPALPVTPPDVVPAKPAAHATNSVTFVPNAAAPPSVSVIAESSLKAPLQELAQTWADNQDNSPQVPITLTNTGTIRAKATSGGGAFDVVISADLDDIKAMTDAGVLSADGQRSLARNTLVVYGRKALVKDDELDWFDLVGSEWKKVALGNPDLVASGRVARRALQKHNLISDDNKDLFVYAVTDALALNVVAREQADAVFAFKTDAAKMSEHGFEVMPIASQDAPPVFYTAAVSRQAKNPAQARAFIEFLGSDAARPIWTKYGFETN